MGQKKALLFCVDTWAQRLGYLLELGEVGEKTEPLRRFVEAHARDYALLSPGVEEPAAQRHKRWKLVISKALIEIFSHPLLGRALAFRGGTALYKLFIRPPARYSEDIDLVQIETAAAGPVMDALHEVLDPWLGRPRYKHEGHGFYKFYAFVRPEALASGWDRDRIVREAQEQGVPCMGRGAGGPRSAVA